MASNISAYSPGALNFAVVVPVALNGLLISPPFDTASFGSSAYSNEALVSTIVAFSQMTAQLGDRLLEAEINPVFVLNEGQGVKAADGVVVLADAG